MVFEEWAAFQTGLLLTFVFLVIVIIYFKLRERVSNLEKILRRYKFEVSDESTDKEDDEKPKEL